MLEMTEHRKRQAEYMREYRKKNPVNGTAEWVRKSPQNALKSLYRKSKSRARIRGIVFLLSFEEFSLEVGGAIPDLCPVFGIPLRIGDKKYCPNSPTVDRLDSGRPYEIGNVFIISHRANMIKSLGTAEEHEAIARWMRSCHENVRPCAASAA